MPDATTPEGRRVAPAPIVTSKHDGIPPWAKLSAAWKLLVETVKHPNSGKAVIVNRDKRTVEVVSIDRQGRALGATVRGRRIRRKR